jgi:DNA repair protein RecN (Recombination protein N)
VDALGLALGDRADTGMIRNGCDRAEITAVFTPGDNREIKAWLQEHDLESGEECILRRVLVTSGSASRAYINGSPVPVKLLQAFGDLLVDIHGQHAHHSLLRRGYQLDLLDEYAAHGKLRREVEEQFRLWREADEKLARLRRDSSDRSEQLELLRYQVKELEELQLEAGEIESLTEEQQRLSNAGRLQESCGAQLGLLYENDNALHSQLTRGTADIEELVSTDPALSEPRELMENAAIQIQEAAHALRHYLDRLELDPARLEHVDQRLAEIHELSRKHRCKDIELPALLTRLQGDLETLEHADIHLADLEKEVEELRSGYLELAQKLSEQRQKAGQQLQQEVTEGMQSLGMPGGSFEVGLETLEPENATASGLNRVELLVSANPGQPVKPLVKVASGGELSRISLAIQVATARCSGVPVLIFDEVDVGIGGGTAEIVGQLLRQLGQFRQVLCVTHLAQVAAQGHNHLQVAKSGDSEEVWTEVNALVEEERISEVARMLGGLEITDHTLAHAREMIANSTGS